MSTRIMVMALVAMVTSCLLAAPATRPGTQPATATATASAASAPAAVDIKGVKVLVAFDLAGPAGGEAVVKQRTAQVEKAVAIAGAKVVAQTRLGYYLLDVAGKKPEDVVKALPFHQGAIIFKDGAFDRAISFQNPYQPGQVMEPRPQAVRTWGSGMANVQAMKRESAQLSRLPGVKAEGPAAGSGATGAFKMVLTPKGGTTLLEVFVLTEGEFDYRTVGGDADVP